MSHLPAVATALPATRSLVALLSLSAVLTLLFGCGQPEPATDADPRALRVEFAACAAVREGPICVQYKSWGLRLWIKAPPAAKIEINVDSAKVIPERIQEVQGGLTYFLPVLSDGRVLTVHARDGAWSSTWQLILAKVEEPAWELDIIPLIDQEDLDAVVARLRTALETEPEHQHGLILSKLVRGDRTLTVSEQEAQLLDTIRDHRQRGRLSHLVNDSTMLAWLYLRNGWRIAEARAVLDELDPPETTGPQSHSATRRQWPRPGWPVETAYYVAYYRGLLADATGDSRQAVLWAGRAARQAARAGLGRKRLFADQLLALTLRRAGQHTAAAERFADLERLAEQLPTCDRALIANAIAWDHLLAREIGQEAEDPSHRIESALALYRESSCPDLTEAGNMLINLALARLQNNDPEAALRHLEEAAAIELEPPLNHLVWWQDIAARVAVMKGRPTEALALYRELDSLAVATDSPDARWRAAFGRARALEELGQDQQALIAYAEAEVRLDEASLRVPVHLNRAQFAAPHEPATRQYIDLLLRADRAEEALAVVRRARVRSLRGLVLERQLARLDANNRRAWDHWTARYRARREQIDRAAAEDWRLPSDQRRQALEARAAQRQELRDLMDQAYDLVGTRGIEAPPLPGRAPGELILAYHPLPAGWVALAFDDQGVSQHRIGELDAGLDPDGLAARLLIPFASAIEQAKRIRVLPYGFLRQVDFHALPFAGGVLLDAAPVVYGLDLPPPAPVTAAATRRALVVADPSNNLPRARQEANAVVASLRAAGWQVDLLRGDRVTAERLRQGLGRAALFHFAGHGAFAATGPWDSALPLAAGARLTVGDVLALARTPERVMLLACESARSDDRAPGESVLGLAQAFMASGTSRVLASLRPVGDQDAAELARLFYEAFSRGDSEESALRFAQQSLREQRPEADWASFRLLVR